LSEFDIARHFEKSLSPSSTPLTRNPYENLGRQSLPGQLLRSVQEGPPNMEGRRATA